MFAKHQPYSRCSQSRFKKKNVKQNISVKTERDEIKRSKRNEKRKMEVNARSDETDMSIISNSRDHINDLIKKNNS